MKYNLLLTALICMLCANYSHSQSLAINTDGSMADPSALLDVKAHAKGLLIPRLTKAEKNGIAAPATGLLIFQNSPDSVGFHFYNGSSWTWLGDASLTDSASWKTTGNSNMNSTHFLGTLNDAALRFRIRNMASGILDSASQNTSLGYRSLLANSSGNGNTALGYRSMASNTSGGENVAIGDSALHTNQTGTGLVAVGYNALAKNKSGDENTAIGYQALANDTTGLANTAIGAYTLHANSRGFANTALGASALSSSTIGRFNTAAGYLSLYLHFKNDGNTAIGSNAMQNDTTGYNNTAIGLNALLANTNGFYNTAIGYNTLTANTTGTNNTGLGAQVNLSANNLTNATALGYRAMVAQSNSLVLGSINGINGAVTDTKVGIGTTTPSAILDVSGNFKMGITGTVNSEIIKVTVNKDLAAVASGASNTETFTVTNALTGSTVYISPEFSFADGLLIAYARVSAAATVEVKFTNTSGISIDPPAMNFYITVFR